MVLLERGTFLGSLDGWLAQATDGHGCLVLVVGEGGFPSDACDVDSEQISRPWKALPARRGRRSHRSLRSRA